MGNLVPVETPWNLLWIHLECWAAKLRCYGPSIWSNLIRNCTAMAQLSKVESANQWAFIHPSLELISRCSLSTSTLGLSVRTRFSRYKGCRPVGTKINKILNCYLPFVAAGAGTNVQILHSAWSEKVRRRRIQGRVNISFPCRERYRGALSSE